MDPKLYEKLKNMSIKQRIQLGVFYLPPKPPKFKFKLIKL